jgi:hypothetical protein
MLQSLILPVQQPENLPKRSSGLPNPDGNSVKPAGFGNPAEPRRIFQPFS